MAVIYGSAGENNSLLGTHDDDSIFGLSGADTIRALSGSDRVYGGSGHDTSLYGDSGNDRIFGDAGHDSFLVGNDGDDRIFGDSGDDSTWVGRAATTGSMEEMEAIPGSPAAPALTASTAARGTTRPWSDTAFGGSGADWFRFSGGVEAGLIGDFDGVSLNGANGEDKLVFVTGLEVGSFSYIERATPSPAPATARRTMPAAVSWRSMPTATVRRTIPSR